MEDRPPQSVAEAFEHAQRIAPEFPSPGLGATRRLWDHLAALAAADLAVARAIEPHLDACAIFTQAGLPLPKGAWGVFASEGGPCPVVAVNTGDDWAITGEKLWCSLATELDGALVTAATDAGPRLFAIDLRDAGVQVREGAWMARGLVEIPSGPVSFDTVRATPVGGPGWYLERDGFWWGGIGVAACWLGGAIGLMRTLQSAAAAKPGPYRAAHLGTLDTLLHACRLALHNAADAIDERREVNGPLLAYRVRSLVARTCEETIWRVGHALGPAPLAMNEDHAKRVSDLQLYIRQHHAERDDAAQGTLLLQAETLQW
ncbi:hypothetical protein [Leucobacter japonicus]|uniref:hypothetical protein n=1 Tax=Leucobacter japonicus TaxID=1461259 RepID=UPI0006A7BE7D|nr:hypothetical protein [Leucobacter japonicus]